MFTTKSLVLVASFVGLSTQAGPLMKWPQTYTLLPTGEPVIQPEAYPCNFEATGGYKPYPIKNTVPLGEKQELDLEIDYGRADSGSCQLSLTTDVPPTKDSVIKVLHSIEGGCFADKIMRSGEILPPQDFTIPNDIAPGNYSFLWSWLAKERPYMTIYCAPVTLVESETETPTEEEKKLRETGLLDRSDLPEMFWGSLMYNDTCIPPLGKALAYPDPGKSVERRIDDSELSAPTYCYPDLHS